MNEPTYSQIMAACRAMWPLRYDHDYGVTIATTDWDAMKRALMAAQNVDPNIYGHMHYGLSVGGVTLMMDSKRSQNAVMKWHHDSTSTLPYHEKHTIPELIRLRASRCKCDD
jgi:hypothetical protein